jgi:nucleoside-diphosphate-sugar epimerase
MGYEVINLGNNQPHKLSEMISLVETYLEKKARIKRMDFQKTDMMATWADVDKARRLLDWEPEISLSEGLEKTVNWYVQNKEWTKDIVIDMSK